MSRPGGDLLAAGGSPRWTVGETVAETYRVLGVHDGGGMGLVHQVRHLRWGVDLAVKSPRPEMFRSATDRERFTAEAQTWVSLGLHPHVCACHYVRVLDGVPRVFAEYLAGGSVREWIDDRRLYKGTADEVIARITDIAVQVAWGLAHAHERGVVHQDVKPANVLLDADGTAKVTDFGIAKARASVSGHRPAPSDPALSVLVSRGGMTPAYASPEQAGGEALTRRTDVWSLAVSIMEMFTGGISWATGVAAPYALEDYRRHGPPEPHLPPMPGPLHDLLARCLRFDQAQRPPTMTAVAEALVAAYERASGLRYPRPAPRPADLRADELTNRALSLLDLGRPDEADRAFGEALAADPHHVHAVYNSALLRWRRAEIHDDAVVAQLTDAAAAAPDPDADDLLAQIHLERGDLDAAGGGPDAAQDGPDAAQDGAGDLELRPAAAIIRPGADGRHVVGNLPLSTNLDGEHAVVVWDIESGAALCELRGHPSRVYAADLTGDGRLAVSGGGRMMLGLASTVAEQYYAVRVWDVVRGTCRHVLNGHTSEVRSVRISADGRLAVSGSADRTVRVWSLATGSAERVFTGHRDQVTAVDVSADGRLAVSGGMDGTVRLLDVVNGRTVRVHENRRQVTAVALSADGRRLAFGDKSGWLHVADVDTGSFRRIRAHPSAVYTVSLNPAGGLAVSGGDDGAVRIWATATGRCLRTCAGHRDHKQPWSYPYDLSSTFTADGRRAVSTGRHTVRLWRLPTGHTAPLVPCRPRSHPELTRTQDRVRILLADVDRALDEQRNSDALALLRRARTVPGHERTRPVLDAWRRLADRSVRVGLRTVWPAAPLVGHSESINAIAVSEEPDRAITAGADGTVRLWDLDSGRCLQTITGYDDVYRVAVSRDGRRVLFIGADNALHLWTGASVEKVADNVVGPFGVEDRFGGPLAVSADGRYALTSSLQRRVTMWDVTDGTARRILPERELEATELHLSPDARWAVEGDIGGTRVWDMENDRLLGMLWPRRDDVPAALRADGRWLLATGAAVHLVDPFTGASAAALEGHTGLPRWAQFSPDGQFVVSGDDDHVVRIWDLRTATCIRELHTGSRLRAVRFSADARFVLAGTVDGVVLAWELDWDLDAPEVADRHDDARPLLDDFLTQHGGDAGTWNPADVDALLRRLRRAGLGWLRPEGIRAELLRMAAGWNGPAELRMNPVAATAVTPYNTDPPAARYARTQGEALLSVEMDRCLRCGSTPLVAGEQAEPVTSFGSKRWIRIPGHCPACTNRVHYWFELSAEEPGTTADRRFGGARPSQVLDAAQWLGVADRAIAHVTDPLGEFAPAERERLRTEAMTAAAAVSEILKFIPDGADRVPASAFWTAAGSRRHRAAPDEFARTGLEARLAAHLRVAATL